jgi:hypothetical protein
MPSLTKDHTLAASNVFEIVHLPVDFHVIKAATLLNLTTTTKSLDNWASLCILAGGSERENILTILSTGYTGILCPVTWTGSLPVEADHYVAALISGKAGDTFRLSAILWKIRLDEKGEFRADP